MRITQAEADTLDDWFCPKCTDKSQLTPGLGQKRKNMQRTELFNGEVESRSVNDATVPEPVSQVDMSAPLAMSRIDHVEKQGSMNGVTMPLPSVLSYSSFVPSSYNYMAYPAQYADKYLQGHVGHVPVTTGSFMHLPSLPYYHNYPPQYSSYSNGM